MPTYEYRCKYCRESLDLFHSMKERRRKCPKCKRYGLKRQIGSGAALIFKGSGFYETDYKRQPAPKKEGQSTGETATSKPLTESPKKPVSTEKAPSSTTGVTPQQ